MFFFICSVSFKFAAASLFFLHFFLFAAFAFYFVCSASFLFAAFIFCLQRIFFICSVRFLFAAFVFLFAAHLFCLQRSFFVCSVRFLFAAHLFCLQRFSLLAACPLWAIVVFRCASIVTRILHLCSKHIIAMSSRKSIRINIINITSLCFQKFFYSTYR